MSEENGNPKKTLNIEEIATERQLGRRSTLGIIGASLAGAAAATMGAALLPRSAQAQSDSDTGRYADPAGRGRSGVTDSDSGPNADRAGHGRGQRTTGVTDSDSGPNADAAGNGRGRNCSDSDGGQYADPAGRGRRC